MYTDCWRVYSFIFVRLLWKLYISMELICATNKIRKSQSLISEIEKYKINRNQDL